MGGYPSSSNTMNNGYGSGLASHLQCIAALRKEETEIVKMMMPVYYDESNLSEEEFEAACTSWNLILENKAKRFIQQKKRDENFPHTTSFSFFHHVFYSRLHDVHPIGKEVFNDPSGGKFLTRLLQVILYERNDTIKFRITLAKLAEIHHSRGVKAVECKCETLLSSFNFL